MRRWLEGLMRLCRRDIAAEEQVANYYEQRALFLARQEDDRRQWEDERRWKKEIESRAYYKWIDAGKPDGKSHEFWEEAEREVNEIRNTILE